MRYWTCLRMKVDKTTIIINHIKQSETMFNVDRYLNITSCLWGWFYDVLTGHINIHFFSDSFCLLPFFRNCTANIRYECLFLSLCGIHRSLYQSVWLHFKLTLSVFTSLPLSLSLVPSVVALTVMVALVSHWHAPIAPMSATFMCPYNKALIL